MLASSLQVYTVCVSLDRFAHDCFDYIATSGDLAHATLNLLITFSLKINFHFLTLTTKITSKGLYFKAIILSIQ